MAFNDLQHRLNSGLRLVLSSRTLYGLDRTLSVNPADDYFKVLDGSKLLEVFTFSGEPHPDLLQRVTIAVERGQATHAVRWAGGAMQVLCTHKDYLAVRRKLGFGQLFRKETPQ